MLLYICLPNHKNLNEGSQIVGMLILFSTFLTLDSHTQKEEDTFFMGKKNVRINRLSSFGSSSTRWNFWDSWKFSGWERKLNFDWIRKQLGVTQWKNEKKQVSQRFFGKVYHYKIFKFFKTWWMITKIPHRWKLRWQVWLVEKFWWLITEIVSRNQPISF
jgi:hypothetical protein